MKYTKEFVKKILISNSTYNPNTKCLVWNKGLHGINGYGGWRKYRTHRLAAWVYGIINDIDDPRLICHKNECTKKSCIAKYHLYAGSYIDNAKDKSEFGNANNQNKNLIYCKKNLHKLEGKNLGIGTKGERFCRCCARKTKRDLKIKKKFEKYKAYKILKGIE
jgi:hypothetical protein